MFHLILSLWFEHYIYPHPPPSLSSQPDVSSSCTAVPLLHRASTLFVCVPLCCKAKPLLSTSTAVHEHDTLPDSSVQAGAERPRLDADIPVVDQIADASISHGFFQVRIPPAPGTLPVEVLQAVMAAVHESSVLDADIPVVDLANPDRPAVVSQIVAACSSHGLFQVRLPPGMLPVEVLQPVMAAEHEFRYNCRGPLEQFRDVVSPYFNQVRELGFRIYAAIWENPRTNAPMINLTDQLQIVKNEDLEQLGILGSGAFGTVYHAKWKGTDVAVKRFSTVPSSEQAQEFWREADILSKLHHPNVVAFYGVVKDGPGGTLATLTEFMVNGSLGNVLRSKDKGLDLRKRLIVATDAAIGMEYLHSKNIVHFDLKSYNLLVDLRDHSRPICKVCDFGLSKIKRTTLVSGGMRGTPLWMAPELFDGATKVTEKVDVFSFGIVMWELLTGEVPYANMHYGAIIGGVVNNTLRPSVPANCGPEWRMLMEQCWSPDPTARPAFTEIAARLRSMSAAANQQAKVAATA